MKALPHLLFVLALLGLAGLARPALAQAEISQTQTTAHYTVKLTVGPVATMLMPGEAAGAKEGEVMVQMPGMPAPSMSMTDQGQPVNHHLEVQVLDTASGAVVGDMMPAIMLKDQATGASRQLSDVMSMYDVQVGEKDMHFGNNVYLPDGQYTVTVVVNNETATFANVAVSGGTAAAGNMSGGSMSGGSTMPATGAPVFADYAGLLVLGGLAALGGFWLRWRARLS